MADDDELVDFLRDWKREIAESSDHTSTSQKHSEFSCLFVGTKVIYTKLDSLWAVHIT